MRPKAFIGSSVEGLLVAHAVQASLEHSVEVTVWDQGVFTPSSYTLEAIEKQLKTSDFGIFVFSPDDGLSLRGKKFTAVRDNVLLELGMSFGSLGRERSFIVMPRGVNHFRIPTDLLGLTLGTYDGNRQDGNLQAALGPACSQLKATIDRLGPRVQPVTPPNAPSPPPPQEPPKPPPPALTDADIFCLLQGWFGNLPGNELYKTFVYAKVDEELNLPPGSAARFLHAAAHKYGYVIDSQGPSVVKFKDGFRPEQGSRTVIRT